MITIEPSFDVALSTSALTRFLNRARLAIDLRGEVDILLANDQTLRQLNKTFRGKNKPTDVLSFPAPTAFAKNHAGDLAISLETAARQAHTHGHALNDEIKILILHGLLHLAGEDHETDKGEMAAREATLRAQLRLPNTLIERTTRQPTSQLLRSWKPSSRPKAAHFAAAVEEPALSLSKGPPHFVRATSSATSRKSQKRGAK